MADADKVAQLQAALDAVEDCDAIVAVGTTLGVYPVAALFPLALERGAFGVIVNASETPFDEDADQVVRGQLDDVLPGLLGVAE